MEEKAINLICDTKNLNLFLPFLHVTQKKRKKSLFDVIAITLQLEYLIRRKIKEIAKRNRNGLLVAVCQEIFQVLDMGEIPPSSSKAHNTDIIKR